MGVKNFLRIIYNHLRVSKNTEIGFANLGTSDDSQPQAFLDVQKDGSEVLSSKMTNWRIRKRGRHHRYYLRFRPGNSKSKAIQP